MVDSTLGSSLNAVFLELMHRRGRVRQPVNIFDLLGELEIPPRDEFCASYWICDGIHPVSKIRFGKLDRCFKDEYVLHGSEGLTIVDPPTGTTIISVLDVSSKDVGLGVPVSALWKYSTIDAQVLPLSIPYYILQCFPQKALNEDHDGVLKTEGEDNIFFVRNINGLIRILTIRWEDAAAKWEIVPHEINKSSVLRPGSRVFVP